MVQSHPDGVLFEMAVQAFSSLPASAKVSIGRIGLPNAQIVRRSPIQIREQESAEAIRPQQEISNDWILS
jgi:hypothetical protein